MNKEEILAKSRKENKETDEMELVAQAKAGKLAMAIGLVLCSLVMVLLSIRGEEDSHIWMIYTGMLGIYYLRVYKTVRKKKDLVYGILYLAIAIIFLGIYITEWVIG